MSPALPAVAGLDGYLRRSNPAYSREELPSRPWIDFAHLHDRERMMARAPGSRRPRGLRRGDPPARRPTAEATWAQDYQVFILSRVREAVNRGMSNDDAVAHGPKSTAGVVTSAALVRRACAWSAGWRARAPSATCAGRASWRSRPACCRIPSWPRSRIALLEQVAGVAP